MKKRKLIDKLFLAIVATSFGASTGILVNTVTALAQSSEKKVSLGVQERLGEQIKISKLRVGNSEKVFDDKFSEDKGWIGRTSFEIENTSNQDIVYLSIKVLFPETKTSGNLMAYSFNFGNRPGSRIQTAKPLRFGKGETLTIDLADQYQRITKFISERHAINDINQIELEAGFIVFADGTAWAAGAFMRQDPSDPTRWVQIDMPGYNPIKRSREGGKP